MIEIVLKLVIEQFGLDRDGSELDAAPVQPLTRPLSVLAEQDVNGPAAFAPWVRVLEFRERVSLFHH